MGIINAKQVAEKSETETAPTNTQCPEERRRLIAERAYLKWLSQTGGGFPVSDQQTNQNWCEAEQEIDAESEPST